MGDIKCERHGEFDNSESAGAISRVRFRLAEASRKLASYAMMWLLVLVRIARLHTKDGFRRGCRGEDVRPEQVHMFASVSRNEP